MEKQKNQILPQTVTFEASCGCFKTSAIFDGYKSIEEMHIAMTEWTKLMADLSAKKSGINPLNVKK